MGLVRTLLVRVRVRKQNIQFYMSVETANKVLQKQLYSSNQISAQFATCNESELWGERMEDMQI